MATYYLKNVQLNYVERTVKCFASWIVGAREPMGLSCHIYQRPFGKIGVLGGYFLFFYQK